MIQYLIIFMPKIYYSKRMKNKISKEKPGTCFQEYYLSGVIQDTLNFPSNKL